MTAALPRLRVGTRVTIGSPVPAFAGTVSQAAVRAGVPRYMVAWDDGPTAPVNGTAVLCLQIHDEQEPHHGTA